MDTLTSHSAPTILVVDDNKKNLQVLGNILHGENYKVAMATNGETAIRLAGQLLPSLIILDIMMPGMDGFEVCRTLKSNGQTKEIPVIFLTAKVELDDVVEGFNIGGVDYITKPFRQKELLVRVKNHLELIESKRKIELQARQLELANSFKDKMFSIIGHDLRSPLSSLKFTIDLIVDGTINPNDELFAELFKSLSKSTDEAFVLLENLLNWGKSESGTLVVIPEKIDLKEAAESCIRLLKMNAGNKNIQIVAEVPETLTVFADSQMMGTILRNLVSNAIKFTPEGGKITIGAKDIGQNMSEIAISDTGVGIPPENLPRIFNPTNPVKTFGTNREPGSGLGLVLCRDFVLKNGGQIRVESQVGAGSSFIFTLPMPNNS